MFAEARKKEAIASIEQATSTAMDSINSGVSTVWHNQQHLESEARALHQHAETFNKQTAQWVTAFSGFHQALKALGDVENWARTIESDMAFINSSLEQIQHAQELEPESAPPQVEEAGSTHEVGDAR